MKHLFLAIIGLIFTLNITAQEAEEFYLDFFIKDMKETDTEKIFTATLVNGTLEYDTKWEGTVIPNDTKASEFGKVRYTHVADGGNPMVEIRMEKAVEAKHFLRSSDRGLLKLKVISPTKSKSSHIYQIYRLEIDLRNIEGNMMMFKMRDYDNDDFSADDYYIPELLEESIDVGFMMRDQMDSPMVEEGRFKGMDLFSAMILSNYWDIEAFLKYMIKYPRKYQATPWKFSEIYATWIIDGARGHNKMEEEELIAKLKYKFMEINWISNLDKRKKLLGNDVGFLKTFYNHLKTISEKSLENGILRGEEGAMGHHYAAANVAEYINDKNGMAWDQYQNAQITSAEENYSFAIEEYKEAIKEYKEIDNKIALAKCNIGIGNAYNQLKTKSGYKVGMSKLKKALGESQLLSGNKEEYHPFIALAYSHMGDSYLGLGNKEKALEAYKEGLGFTEIESDLSAKRKALLESKISKL